MTPKNLKFISEYTKDFNATQAAIRAGYSPKTAYSIGQELLKKPEIMAAMKEHTDKLIADRKTRQRFWTQVMNDADISMKDRLKASELLARSECDFIERAEIIASNAYDLSKLSESELIQLRELSIKASNELS